MRIKACLTSKNQIWETPKEIYKYFINNGFFDPCPINPDFDGLNIDWKYKNFVNPPYNNIKKWIDKAILEREKERISILLIPSRTDTKWFRKLIEHNAHIFFIQGRLKFSEGGGRLLSLACLFY